VLDGEYRVSAVDGVDGKPDMLRLTMAPVAPTDGDEGFRLELPQGVLVTRPLIVGDRVDVRHRPYGLQFARADTRQPFFLVVDDDWHRDLQTRVLSR
jgi:hypothetical protein